MKWGLEIREHHAFETHLNLMSDFTGSRERMSVITSFGRLSDIVRQWKSQSRAVSFFLQRRRKTTCLFRERKREMQQVVLFVSSEQLEDAQPLLFLPPSVLLLTPNRITYPARKKEKKKKKVIFLMLFWSHVENWRTQSLCSVALQTAQRVTCSSSFLFESKRVAKEKRGRKFSLRGTDVRCF